MIEYITVVVKVDSFGKMFPLQIVWKDGRTFEVDKILDTRRRASTRGGGAGTRFEVEIMQRRRFLFYDGERFFIET